MNKNKWNLNKSQRMRLKAFIILLGILLILILLFGKLVVTLIHMWENRHRKFEPYIPEIQQISNVWIMELENNGLLVFQDGENVLYPYGMIALKNRRGQEPSQREFKPDLAVREQVADLVLADGKVTGIIPKTNKINGRILSADAEGIEVEGYGKIPLDDDYKGYRLYDSLAMCTAGDIFFGYDFTDLCIDRGRICGILMVKEEAMEYVRVLIKASDYSAMLHTQPVLTCNTGYKVVYGNYEALQEEHHEAGEEVAIGTDSGYFTGQRVWVVPDVLTGKVSIRNCGRSQGTPSYRGKLELFKTDGGIAVINEVLLEEYLYSVVPSEMPSRYPKEALKAQAICARTYAYGCMMHAGYPGYGAHMDDSTTYQVYNNILEQETTTTAVKETYGQLLYTAEGALANTYYYSTSCGVGTDANVWKTSAGAKLTYLKAKGLSRTEMDRSIAASGGGTEQEPLAERLRDEDAFRAFITSKNQDDFEAGESWYRWTYRVEKLDTDRLLELLKKRYKANPKYVLTMGEKDYVSIEPEKLDQITDIYVESRGSGGTADEIVIKTKTQQFKVVTGHNIRTVLCDGTTKVVRQDGKTAHSSSLLPSSFFVIETVKDGENVVGYTLTGGGFGHGVGMSQNGARQMADSGYNAGQILLFFYENCTIKSNHG